MTTLLFSIPAASLSLAPWRFLSCSLSWLWPLHSTSPRSGRPGRRYAYTGSCRLACARMRAVHAVAVFDLNALCRSGWRNYVSSLHACKLFTPCDLVTLFPAFQLDHTTLLWLWATEIRSGILHWVVQLTTKAHLQGIFVYPSAHLAAVYNRTCHDKAGSAGVKSNLWYFESKAVYTMPG